MQMKNIKGDQYRRKGQQQILPQTRNYMSVLMDTMENMFAAQGK